MKKKNTKKQSKTNLSLLKKMTDKDIDYSDIPELDETFFKQAKLVMPQPKPIVTLRLDADILQWFKSKGKGYQTRINAVLRTYMLARR